MKKIIPAKLALISILIALIVSFVFKNQTPLIVNASDTLSGTVSGTLSGSLSGTLSGSVDVKTPSKGIKEGTSDWFKNGTRIRLDSDDLDTDEQIYYRWKRGKIGEDGKYYSEGWKEYRGSIQARSGRNTLMYKIIDSEGNASSEQAYFMKVLEKKRIQSIDVSLKENHPYITWEINSPNISYVRVHRGSSADFTPNTENKLGTNMYWDTDFLDKTATVGKDYYYKLVGYSPADKEMIVRTVHISLGY
jgi:hypothetical protein